MMQSRFWVPSRPATALNQTLINQRRETTELTQLCRDSVKQQNLGAKKRPQSTCLRKTESDSISAWSLTEKLFCEIGSNKLSVVAQTHGAT